MGSVPSRIATSPGCPSSPKTTSGLLSSVWKVSINARLSIRSKGASRGPGTRWPAGSWRSRRSAGIRIRESPRAGPPAPGHLEEKGGALAPGHLEVEVVARAPRQRLLAQVLERELAREAKRGEAVVDAEFVLKRIARCGLDAREEHGLKPARVEACRPEDALAGQPVHGHGAPHVQRIAPEPDVAPVKGAGAKWEGPGGAPERRTRIANWFLEDVRHRLSGVARVCRAHFTIRDSGQNVIPERLAQFVRHFLGRMLREVFEPSLNEHLETRSLQRRRPIPQSGKIELPNAPNRLGRSRDVGIPV